MLRNGTLGLLAICSLVAGCSGGSSGDGTSRPPSASPSSAPAVTSDLSTPPPATGAGAPASSLPGTGAVPTSIDASGFNDHTVPVVATETELLALARAGANDQSVIKFAMVGDGDGSVRLFDSNFYALHDEWYWFRLLNGHSIEGLDVQPVRSGLFATVDDI